MRVLQICSKPPQPALDGGCLASLQLSHNLIEAGATLKIITLSTIKHPFNPALIDKDYLSNTKMEALEVVAEINFISMLINLFSNKSVQEDRFFKKEASEILENHLKNNAYDFIILDGLMACFYLKVIKENNASTVIYRSHNIESFILNQMAKVQTNKFKKIFLNIQSKRLKTFEEQIWNQVDQIWSISNKDKDNIQNIIGTSKNVQFIPFSIKESHHSTPVLKNTVFHLGAMNWKANIEGVFRFRNKVWGKVLNKLPDAQLHLGGSFIGKLAHKLKGPNIHIHEDVKNEDEFYNQYEILIVPISSGSGIRIKMIQALAKGKVIVSTKIGASGMPGKNGENYIICDSDKEMSEQLIQLMQDEALKKKLSQGAINLYNQYFKPEIAVNLIKNSLNIN